MSLLRVLIGVLCMVGVLLGNAPLVQAAPAPPPPAAELFTDSPLLKPTSTFEFRFTKQMVSPEEVGLSPKESPITITPPIPGSFTWLSRSSGVFTPSEPPQLGTEYTVTLRPDLKAADGKPLTGDGRWTLPTPTFKQTSGRTFNPDSLPASPEVGLAFNLPVDLESAAKLFQFVDNQGHTVAAKVQHATQSNRVWLLPDEEGWEQRWRKAKGLEAEKEDAEEGEGSSADETPILSQLLVTPVEALQPGVTWRLEMKGGLAAQDGKHRITKPTTIALGRVQPFRVTKVEPSSYINSGRSVSLEFSGELAQDITEETAAKFIKVEPAVANLRFEGGYSDFTIRGDFARGQEYRLILDPALVSNEGLPPEGGREYKFSFAPVAPRLYLPEITGHQIRSGRRQLEVLSANLKNIRVTARLVSPEETPRAITAFEKYEAGNDETDGANVEMNSDELYQPIPADQIPGKVIHERVIELPAEPIDSRQVTALNWNDILGERKAGAVFLTVEGEPLAEVGGKRVGAQALIQLTDLGILWKKTEEGLRVTAFSMATGKPVEGAQVMYQDSEFASLQSFPTDREGTAAGIKLNGESGWLIVAKGDDAHVMRMGPEAQDLPMAAFRLPIDYSDWAEQLEEQLQLRGFLFTDRPLYRPGETVRVKGILRRMTGNGLATSGPLKVQLQLRDPQGREAAPIDLQTDDQGSFDTEVKLGSTTTGAYYLQLLCPDAPRSRWQRGFHCSFQVTDFQPNAFELNVALPARLTSKWPVQAEVGAKYFFGAPVTKADVRWTLQYAREDFAPEGFYDWSFGSVDGGSGRTLTLRGEGRLGGATPFTIAPELPEAKDAPHRGVLTVETTDLNQQTVTETRIFVRDSSQFYLGVAVPEGAVFRAGGDIAAKAIAVLPTGQPLTKPMDLTAELVHVRHDTVRVQGAGKAIAFRTEKTEEVVAKVPGQTLIPTRQGAIWEARNGASAHFKAPAAGQYKIRVTATDSAGSEVMSELPIYVSGPHELAWDYRNAAQIDLVPDKPEYRPGETARLLVKTPISGEALVSIERGGQVLRNQRLRLDGNAPMIEVPLSAGDAPNVFVNLVIIRGLEESTRKFKTAEYRYGAAMLNVVNPATRLTVDITPARPQVEPGEEFETEVLVRNGSGAAVIDAEVTLFAVDDGILALTGYERPAPREIFLAPFPLAVRTGLTLYETISEDPAELEFSNKGYLIGGGGLEGPGLKLRRNFPGTAAWFPNLRTDRDGKVRVKINAPDALTRYRLVAVAHAGPDLFGSGESAFTIRKSLMLMPALGQFANVGDELIARTVIRNETGADGAVEIGLQLDATAEPAGTGTEAMRSRVELKNGEARAVDFPVRLRAMGDAEWRWTARMEAGGKVYDDQVVSTLLVGSPAPLLRETYLTDLRDKDNDLLANVNPQLLEGNGAVTVTVANTRLASLREGASHLLEYPYGCAEQTMSSLIPWLLTNQLRPVLPALDKPDTEVTATIQKGFDRIFGMQTPNGGIAMWPGGKTPSLFISAYAALGCSLLEGQQIPAGHPALLKYLSEELRGLERVPDETRIAERALALYALAAAGKAEPAYHEQLYARRKEFSRETRAILALAIREANGPAKIIEDLLNPRASAPESFSYYGGAARERAIQLLAFSRCIPRSPEVAKLVKELIAFQRSGHWGTTQQNAWALMALAGYYSAVEGPGKPLSGALFAAQKELPFSLSAKDPAETHTVAFAPATQPLENLKVTTQGTGALFGETRFIVRPPAEVQPRQDRGYSVFRTYRRLADDGTAQEAGELKVGDRVLVTLRVETTRPGHFVAIDDPLPAVFEAVNPVFRSKAVGGGDAMTRDRVSDHQEIRADRVLYFCDHLAPGAYTFSYLARVRSAGSVRAGPTKVEEMYRPERFGLGESMKVTAQLAER